MWCCHSNKNDWLWTGNEWLWLTIGDLIADLINNFGTSNEDDLKRVLISSGNYPHGTVQPSGTKVI